MTTSEPISPPDPHRFPCERCGSDYRFAPAEGVLQCDHCGHTEALEQAGPWKSALTELDLQRALEQGVPDHETQETRSLQCPNCAAQVMFDQVTHATECPFCATPVVIGTGTQRQIKPRALLPFALDERAAKAAMTAWLGQLWFAPGSLQEYVRKGRKMQGIYVPYWTFDANTTSDYRGERGTVYYENRTITRNGKQHQARVAKVRWRAASGRVSRFFDDVLVLASRSLPKKYTDALEPWDLAALEPYQPEYLAGFSAEGYTVDLEIGFQHANRHMDRVIARDVKFDIGGDRQRIHDIRTGMRDVTFKHVLLPVWMATYRYRGEVYRFVVNGRTGRVQGERPWSIWKIAIAVGIGIVVAGAVGYGVAVSQGL